MARRGKPKQIYSDVQVARIKGAVASGIPHKLVARLTGVSESAVGHYSSGTSRKDVEPDPSLVERLREWLHGA